MHLSVYLANLVKNYISHIHVLIYVYMYVYAYSYVFVDVCMPIEFQLFATCLRIYTSKTTQL